MNHNHVLLNEIEDLLLADKNLKQTRTGAAIMQEFERLFAKEFGRNS